MRASIDLKDLERRLLEAVPGALESERVLIAQIAGDAAATHARYQAGEDVFQEARHIHAQTMGLTAVTRSRVNEALLGWFRDIATAFVFGVLSQ